MKALVFGAALLSGIAVNPAAAQGNPERPALIVLIGVDQLRQDYLTRFRSQFTGGLARLLREGAVFTRAYQDHAITETAPGHATMLSGRYPASTGIVSNSHGVLDTTVTLLLTGGRGASPHRFQGTVLLDWVRAREPATRMLSVSRKDRGAILPVGRSRDGVTVIWFDQDRFTTSTYYADSVPAWVARFDSAAAPAKQPGRVWDLLRDSSLYAEADSQQWENRGRAFVFPHALARVGGVVSMPWMDSLLLELAFAGIRAEGLGRRGTPDIVSVGLSTLDAVGHNYGPGSREVHDHLLRMDGYIGAFLDALDAQFGAGRVVVALTSDHGVTALPEASRAAGRPAEYVPVDDVLDEVRSELEGRMGPGTWAWFYDQGMLAFDRAALTARGVNVDSLAAAVAARLRRLRGVARVDTRATLARGDTSRSDAVRRWRRMLAPGTPGEVFITLQPPNYLGFLRDAMHGQPTADDAHVPLIIAGPGVRRGTYVRKTAVVDLGPTLAALVGARPTERVDGRVLREALR